MRFGCSIIVDGPGIGFPIHSPTRTMQQTSVKTYQGNQQLAARTYQEDAAKMATLGYIPTSQVWTPGTYGCGAFILALLLCFVVIGFLIFIYMLIVKPAGTLTVTYTMSARSDPEKTCPQCAESVKAAAALCRYCGHKFETVSVVATEELSATAPGTAQSGAEDFGRTLGRFFSGKGSKK